MPKKKVELLAPAGSFESLLAAIQAGADAVYFGIEQLNMRARSADPFTIDDLPAIKAICTQHNIRAYITLNTVMYEHDMQLLKTVLTEVKKNHIDAVIASDFAVLELCRQMHIPLHISTQANVSNIESVRFFAPFSDLIVLARELTLKQTQDIIREIERKDIKGVSGEKMKIEIFVHGALCMAVSGKCYLSLHSQQASANRGACIQNCRRPYRVTDIESGEELVVDNEYIMSPKDLCTIHILDQIVDIGVDVIKIEGRSKGADYVFAVTSCYREALQAIHDGNYTPDKIKDWQNRLHTVYNRGFWEGYYLGRHLGEWTSNPGSAATERKIYIGKGVRYYPNIEIGEFLIETGTIKSGDTILITSPNFGLHKETISKLTVNGIIQSSASRGDRITLPIPYKISGKDKLYKLVNA
ncbi:MAG: U32 family peptidase [Candidatus Competibacteraceae bacterium]|nr:U32 family peptidase [Candidatus Competibacteraceae bacterium]